MQRFNPFRTFNSVLPTESSKNDTNRVSVYVYENDGNDIISDY